MRARLAIRAVGGHRAEGVARADDPCDARDVLPREPVGVAVAVPVLVARANDPPDVGEHPSDALKTGQLVTAQVLEIDKDRRRLRLGLKQLLPTRTDDFIGEHTVGQVVTGRVAEVHEGRAKIDLGDGVFAQCRLASKKAAPAEAGKPAASSTDVSSLSAMLAQRWKQGTGGPISDDGPKPGQVRTFKITALDAATKKIDLELS